MVSRTLWHRAHRVQTINKMIFSFPSLNTDQHLPFTHGKFVYRANAEQVFHNVELYNTRRSSDNGNINLVAIRPEDIPSLGPQKQQVEGEERPVPSLEINDGPPHQSDDNTTFVVHALLKWSE